MSLEWSSLRVCSSAWLTLSLIKVVSLEMVDSLTFL